MITFLRMNSRRFHGGFTITSRTRRTLQIMRSTDDDSFSDHDFRMPFDVQWHLPTPYTSTERVRIGEGISWLAARERAGALGGGRGAELKRDRTDLLERLASRYGPGKPSRMGLAFAYGLPEVMFRTTYELLWLRTRDPVMEQVCALILEQASPRSASRLPEMMWSGCRSGLRWWVLGKIFWRGVGGLLSVLGSTRVELVRRASRQSSCAVTQPSGVLEAV